MHILKYNYVKDTMTSHIELSIGHSFHYVQHLLSTSLHGG